LGGLRFSFLLQPEGLVKQGAGEFGVASNPLHNGLVVIDSHRHGHDLGSGLACRRPSQDTDFALKPVSQAVLADVQRFEELLQQDLARMNRR